MYQFNDYKVKTYIFINQTLFSLFMTINEKIIKYLDFKGISKRKFTMELKMAEGVLRSGKNIGSGYLKRIKTFCPDLNINWLLYDEGEMLLPAENKENIVNEPQENYKKTLINNEMLLKNEVENLKILLEAKNETIAVLKHQLGIQSKAS